LCASARHRVTRPLWRALEQLTHPGITRHYWHRKSWIEGRCRLALAEGVRRVVIVGAGFDTLALRLAPSFPSVTWVEVDHPATQGQKRRGLSNCRMATPANLHFVGADLARDAQWVQRIDANDQPTLVIAEGLLMYLAPERVQSLLGDQLPVLAPGGLRVIFSYMVRWPTGRGGFRPSSRLVDAWLRRQHEPFTWMMAPDAGAQWLAAMDYEIVEHRRPPYRDAGPAVAPVGLQGENLIEAVRVQGPLRGRATHA
jgi:methyltransferase (TIGR00027 family)